MRHLPLFFIVKFEFNNILNSVSVLLEGEYGIDGVACGVPCVIGRNGIEDILNSNLTIKKRGKWRTLAR